MTTQNPNMRTIKAILKLLDIILLIGPFLAGAYIMICLISYGVIQ
jgi:hypothetical protein